MRKLLIPLFVGLMLFSSCSCGNKKYSNSNTDNAKTTEDIEIKEEEVPSSTLIHEQSLISETIRGSDDTEVSESLSISESVPVSGNSMSVYEEESSYEEYSGDENEGELFSIP